MSIRNRFRILVAAGLAIGLLLLSGCAGRRAGAPEQGRILGKSPGASGEPSSSLYLQLVEGLHVTGTPVEVDSSSYRLRVGGAVERPLALSLEQLRALPAVRRDITLVCPGFFTDRGVWTGVPVRDLLALAGVRPGAGGVVFTSLSGGYSSALSLEDAQADGVLLAYEFEGRPLPAIHGYPLRLAAQDQTGSVWVKWLGELQVTE